MADESFWKKLSNYSAELIIAILLIEGLILVVYFGNYYGINRNLTIFLLIIVVIALIVWRVGWRKERRQELDHFRIWRSTSSFRRDLVEPLLSDIPFEEGISSRVLKVSLTSGEAFTIEAVLDSIHEQSDLQGIIAGDRLFQFYACLIFWDVIFYPLKNIKITNMPSDLYEEKFYSRREELFDKVLFDIESSDLFSVFKEKLNKHYGKSSELIPAWPSKEDCESFVNIAACLPRLGFMKALLYMMMNYQERHTGWPDLILLKTNGEAFLTYTSTQTLDLKDPQKEWIKWNREVAQLPLEIMMVDKSFSSDQPIQVSVEESKKPEEISEKIDQPEPVQEKISPIDLSPVEEAPIELTKYDENATVEPYQIPEETPDQPPSSKAIDFNPPINLGGEPPNT